MVPSCIRAFALVLLGVMVAPLTAAFQNSGGAPNGRTISGRVLDPHQLRPEDLTLMVGRRDNSGESFGSYPVSFNTDGSFVTPRLDPESLARHAAGVRGNHHPGVQRRPVAIAEVPAERRAAVRLGA